MSEALTKLIGALIGVVLVSFLTSYPLMILWNECLVPALPMIEKVGWIQMWGITVLVSSMCK